jgi:hypothetical protein
LALLRQEKQDITFEEAKSKVVAAVREQALFSSTTLSWENSLDHIPAIQRCRPFFASVRKILI